MVYPMKKETLKYTVYALNGKRSHFASKKEAEEFASKNEGSTIEKKKPEAYEEMKSFLLASKKGQTLKLRPIQETSKGRYTKYGVDHSNEYKRYASELGLKLAKEGNDAPRGGQLGKYLVFEKE